MKIGDKVIIISGHRGINWEDVFTDHNGKIGIIFDTVDFDTMDWVVRDLKGFHLGSYNSKELQLINNQLTFVFRE